MKHLVAVGVALISASSAAAYDCSNHKPFIPIEYQTADIYVGHFYWVQTDSGKKEIVEDVCSSTQPLKVPVLDIRGREDEWYYCHDDAQTELTCTSSFRGAPTTIKVKPAVVIRSWSKSFARDSHFHAYILPNNDPTRYFDLFARSLSSSGTRQRVTIDAAGGGRGENSDVDSFYVRIDFE